MELESTPDFLAARERMNESLMALGRNYTPGGADKTSEAMENLITVIAKYDKRTAYYMAWSVYYGAVLAGVRSNIFVQNKFLEIASRYGKVGMP
ncbi:hypothetical protein [Selenomonas sp. AE3005]|uniref:hypothetical protein n=1 Tax=Selenomonas sp. AE3005 TaxID=1485543 RepID=UPI0025F3E181|nr:hypothetical protein [Selenomonas sp. AE3005]